ncbi:hypothetical protein [Microbacterium sp. OVT16B]|uniref:hypothetical protein n=1 Tax=Microbacterium sp. OVT16B TaxID=2862682 RepID=UPI001CC08BEB|nr:hypothetical protein [Microbacterium sp. OVT16B]
MIAKKDGIPPRTQARPMAFTDREALRGGIDVWWIFLVFLVIGIGVWCTALDLTDGVETSPSNINVFLFAAFCALVIGGTISLIVMPVGVMLAIPLGRALSRSRRLWVHIVVYTALGIAIGLVYIALLRGGEVFTPIRSIWDYVLFVPAVSASLAVPLGWWCTARRLLLADRRRTEHRTERPHTEGGAAGSTS